MSARGTGGAAAGAAAPYPLVEPDLSGDEDGSPAPGDGRTSGPVAAVPGRARWLRPSRWLPLAVTLAVVAAVWSVVAARSPYLLPPLPAVGEALMSNPAAYLGNAGSTLGVAGLGLAVGTAVALAVAVAVSEVAVLRRALMPLAVVLNVTPVVALAPGLVVAFGFGPTPKVVVTAVIVLFPVLVNTSTGLRSVDPGALQVLTTLDASRAEVLWRLRVPSAAPYVFAALRVVVPLSLVGAVVAEFVAAGSSSGLGTMVAHTSSMNQLAPMVAAIACLAAMGVALLALVTAAERRALHWHESQRVTR